MDSIETVIIGSGVIGLAIARAFSMAGFQVIVLESEGTFGSQTSARNSEVIHGGLYYPTGSLKARACVRGRQLLYEYCHTHGINHRRCGKLIVATHPSQLEKLDELKNRALDNGVTDIANISLREIKKMEPELQCVEAIHSPSTGIIDSHSLMLSYLGEAEDHAALLALNTVFEKGECKGKHFIFTANGNKFQCDILINAAGLKAPHVAKLLDGFPKHCIPPQYYAKGQYFTLTGKQPFSHLIYPLPEPDGLGVHVTLDSAGKIRFGPDVEWVQEIEYSMDPSRADAFYSEIRKYWPALSDNTLRPDYCGIRPKIVGPGEPSADFIIQDEQVHGIPGLINLFGIESPGLTSSLALAEDVLSRFTDYAVRYN